MNKLLIFFFFLNFLSAMAQEEVVAFDVNEDDLGNVSDAFKENFFDALSEKARENHDRAIEKLLVCEQLEPDNAAVQFELAKNYMASNAFAKAESNLLTAIKIAGEREWLLDTLFEVYNQQQEFKKAANTLEKLAAINEDYEQLLPAAYMRNNDKEKTIAILNVLDRKWGKNDQRTAFRNRLERSQELETVVTDNLEKLEEQLQGDPKNEQIYIQLMYGYSRMNNLEKTLELAEKLTVEIPDSDKAHLALYKIYLENGDLEKAMESLDRIMGSNQLETDSKIEVLKDFLNTATESLAVQALVPGVLESFGDQVEDIDAYKALGDYFKENKQLMAALQFYELGLALDSRDYDLIKNGALLYLDTGAFAKAEQLSTTALDSYPSQPLLYLINGAALNQMGNAKKAVVQLDTGLSYLLDEPQLERDLYGQLAIAYDKLGDSKKADDARSRIKAISN